MAMDETKNGPASHDGVRERVIEVLKTCYDPEIPVNIYELGLVYEVAVSDRPPEGAPPAAVSAEGGTTAGGAYVAVTMTLTSPMCPVAGTLPPEVEQKVRALPEVADARVNLVWDPPWNPNMMSEAARLQLNIF
jgi:metal-sulfur cluster biosynthetic enzyme